MIINLVRSQRIRGVITKWYKTQGSYILISRKLLLHYLCSPSNVAKPKQSKEVRYVLEREKQGEDVGSPSQTRVQPRENLREQWLPRCPAQPWLRVPADLPAVQGRRSSPSKIPTLRRELP